MPYDINSIRRTTEKGIPNLADKIFAGIVNEEEAINALFMGLRPKLTKELEKRKADEVLWIAASESKELKKLKDYVETYDNEAPEYIGRHIDEANSLISLIENDDAEWYNARSKDSISAYRHYLDIYDNPAPSYRGKYIDQVNEAIKIVKDRDDWAKVKESNSIRSYSEYLSMYDKEAPAYIGRFVNEAQKAILSLEDDAAWQLASDLNTVESYQAYLGKYDIASSSYRGKYVESAKQKIEELQPPPPPDPRITDDEAWNNAIKVNTIESYKEYLYEYANPQNTYKGIHVKEAKQALFRLQDEFDWNVAKSEHTIESYQHYISIYSASNEFVGRHVDEARQAIDKLTPPDPRIEDDNAWKEATRINSLDGYRHYLSLYKNHANEAELAIRHLIDEKAWKDAKDEGTIASYENYLSICKVNEYPGYEWTHVNAAKTQIGNLRKAEEVNRKEEERKRRIAEDNAAWEKARKDNTKHSYEEYLAKYRKAGGLHIREVENAILKLQSDEDWQNACAENTLSAYKRFVDKYEPMSNKYMSMHLPKAKKKVEELTPDPAPFKWKKWFLIVLALALCWFLWIQWQDNVWPFNIFQGNSDDSNEIQNTTVVVEEAFIPTQEELDLDSIKPLNEDTIVSTSQSESHTLTIPANYIRVDAGRVKDKVYDNKKDSYIYPEYDLDTFYIDAFELTQSEYVRVMGSMKPHNYSYESLKPKGYDWGESIEITLKNDSLPVLGKYPDFVEYCNKRSYEEGYDGFYIVENNEIKINPQGNGYRLPTALEWTFAAKGGNLNERYKHIGGNDLKEVAWYGANSGNKPHLVGHKKPNGLGLYDMAGNVTELHHTGKNNKSYEIAGVNYMHWKQMYDDDWWSPYCTGMYYGKYNGKDQISGCRLVFVPKGQINNNLYIEKK